MKATGTVVDQEGRRALVLGLMPPFGDLVVPAPTGFPDLLQPFVGDHTVDGVLLKVLAGHRFDGRLAYAAGQGSDGRA